MMKKNLGRAAVAALAGIVAAGTATAGPLATRTTTTGASTITETFSKSLTVDGITKTINSIEASAGSTITETFAAITITPSVMVVVSQSDLNYTSPHHNDGTTGSITQSITVTGSAGITQAQATAGNANVTVASNGLYSGSALSGVVGTIAPTSGINGLVAALSLLPGFALQNSNAVSLDLMVAQFAATASGGATPSYLEINQDGVSEYSPHHNEGVTGPIAQTVGVNSNAGITQSQVQAGNANVQAAHNVILYNASFSGTSSN